MNVRQRKRAIHRAVRDTVVVTINFAGTPEQRAALLKVLKNAPNILRDAVRRRTRFA